MRGAQYEKTINQGLRTIYEDGLISIAYNKRKRRVRTGKRMWQPATTERGKMTAQAEPSTRHSTGTSGVLRMMMPKTSIQDTSHENQKRLKILGISLKKFDRSTSFLVAPHVMLYEKQWARIACETGIESPPKKKKLEAEVSDDPLRTMT